MTRVRRKSLVIIRNPIGKGYIQLVEERSRSLGCICPSVYNKTRIIMKKYVYRSVIKCSMPHRQSCIRYFVYNTGRFKVATPSFCAHQATVPAKCKGIRQQELYMLLIKERSEIMSRDYKYICLQKQHMPSNLRKFLFWNLRPLQSTDFQAFARNNEPF